MSVRRWGHAVADVEVEYGYATGQQFEVCAHVVGARRMVCGRRVWRIAVSIEEPGDRLHERCAVLLAGGPEVFGPRCQVCGQAVALVGGLVAPHGRCVGVNLPPRGG